MQATAITSQRSACGRGHDRAEWRDAILSWHIPSCLPHGLLGYGTWYAEYHVRIRPSTAGLVATNHPKSRHTPSAVRRAQGRRAARSHRMAARVLKSAEYSTGFEYPAAAT
jgi:hypothetical protein